MATVLHLTYQERLYIDTCRFPSCCNPSANVTGIIPRETPSYESWYGAPTTETIPCSTRESNPETRQPASHWGALASRPFGLRSHGLIINHQCRVFIPARSRVNRRQGVARHSYGVRRGSGFVLCAVQLGHCPHYCSSCSNLLSVVLQLLLVVTTYCQAICELQRSARGMCGYASRNGKAEYDQPVDNAGHQEIFLYLPRCSRETICPQKLV